MSARMLARGGRLAESRVPTLTAYAMDLASVCRPGRREGAGQRGASPANPGSALMPGALASERITGTVQTVLIVDDHAGFRSLARRLLEAAGYEVVGEAHDGASAIELAWGLRPAIVLLDVQLPDLDGFEVARRLADEGLGAATVRAVLVRRGKGGKRREVGMDRWAWGQLDSWLEIRREL